eukprot:TRINITY_DN1348_c0_g1_i1.p1 TRINITY_DN1348_c0_g1~~TRINITY_DN1348_c0_g1_i1.p1  ORF type:complete len:104 (+),score=4.77 TRINITY_DN1348_c0_g1_i1:484-795(+)
MYLSKCMGYTLTKKSAVITSSSLPQNLAVPIVTTVPYLNFTFDQQGICSKAAKFIEKLPSKYLRIKKLHLSTIGMKNFFNFCIPLSNNSLMWTVPLHHLSGRH